MISPKLTDNQNIPKNIGAADITRNADKLGIEKSMSYAGVSYDNSLT